MSRTVSGGIVPLRPVEPASNLALSALNKASPSKAAHAGQIKSLAFQQLTTTNGGQQSTAPAALA